MKREKERARERNRRKREREKQEREEGKKVRRRRFNVIRAPSYLRRKGNAKKREEKKVDKMTSF